MKEKVENWKKEFAMFVPEDDGTATDWFDNVLSQQKEEITKRIKTVGATGTEEEVDKLIEMIKNI